MPSVENGVRLVQSTKILTALDHFVPQATKQTHKPPCKMSKMFPLEESFSRMTPTANFASPAQRYANPDICPTVE